MLIQDSRLGRLAGLCSLCFQKAAAWRQGCGPPCPCLALGLRTPALGGRQVLPCETLDNIHQGPVASAPWDQRGRGAVSHAWLRAGWGFPTQRQGAFPFCCRQCSMPSRAACGVTLLPNNLSEQTSRAFQAVPSGLWSGNRETALKHSSSATFPLPGHCGELVGGVSKWMNTLNCLACGPNVVSEI